MFPRHSLRETTLPAVSGSLSCLCRNGPIETPNRCHHSSTPSEGISFTKVERNKHLKTPTSKRRPRRRHNRNALRCAGENSPNAASPKHVTKGRLIGKTKRKREASRRRIVHMERVRQRVNSSKRQTILRSCHMKHARTLPAHPGKTTVKTSRVPWPNSTKRRCHRRWKHRWKQKIELSVGG